MNAPSPTPPPVLRRAGPRVASLRRWLCLGLAVGGLCLPVCLRLLGQAAPGAATTDLPTDQLPVLPVPTTVGPDGTPAPSPTSSLPPPSSLLIDPGATPAPLPAPNYLPPVSNAPRPSTGSSPFAPPPPGAGGPLPTDAPNGPNAPNAVPDPAAQTATAHDVRRFRYNFRFALGTTYSDNILLNTSGGTSDVFFTVSPAIILGYGDIERGNQSNFLSFSYSPEAILYVEHPKEDALQHFITLNGIYHLGQITLNGSQTINLLDSTDFSQQSVTGGTTAAAGTGVSQPVNNVNLDAAQRTRVNIYATALGASYAYTDKTSFDLNLQLSISDYRTLISSETYTGSVFANYALSGKITTGLGVTGGYLTQDDTSTIDKNGKKQTVSTPDETFEQVNVRLSYLLSEKFTFNGQAGLEVRQTDGPNDNAVNPVFSIGLSYAPFDSTALSLGASRQVTNSAVSAGQNFTTTNLIVSLSQRFLQKIYVRLSLGYINSDYTLQTNTAGSEREDNYFFIQPAVDINVRDNVSLGAFYLHRENHSSNAFSAFQNNQVGAHLTFSF